MLQRKQSRCHRLPATGDRLLALAQKEVVRAVHLTVSLLGRVRETGLSSGLTGGQAGPATAPVVIGPLVAAQPDGEKSGQDVPSSNALPSSRIWCLSVWRCGIRRAGERHQGRRRTSPHPLQGNTSSLSTDWLSRYSSTIMVMAGSWSALVRGAGGKVSRGKVWRPLPGQTSLAGKEVNSRWDSDGSYAGV